MDANPYRPPRARLELPMVPPEPPHEPGEPASRWVRYWASMIDGALMFGLVWIVFTTTPALEGVVVDGPDSAPFVIALAFSGLGVFLLLHGFLLATAGQTIGKRLLGTRMVDARTGARPPFMKMFLLRYVILGLLGSTAFVGHLVALVDALFIFRRDRRCLHDLMAGTRVVKVAPQRAVGARTEHLAR